MYLVWKKNITKIIKIITFFLFFVFVPYVANAANLSINPSSGTFEVGDRVSLKVMVTNNNVLFNAVSAVVEFPNSIFKVDSVSKTNSFLNFWVTEPAVVANTVKFEGVALGGFNSFTGTAITINLRAVAPGNAKISFKSGQVLANDGEGTDITNNLVGANYVVKEAVLKEKPKVEIKPEVKDEEPEIIPEIVQPEPTLVSPEIILSSKYGVPAILGKSDYSKADALVTFLAEDGSKIFVVSNTDENGNFDLLIPRSLKHGVYNVNAVVVKKDNTNSNVSNTIKVTIGNIFSDTAGGIWALIALLLGSIMYLLLRIYFHFRKDKNIHKVIKNEVIDTEKLVHESFDDLRDEIKDYEDKDISIVERRHINSIKRDIDSVEKIITKEVDEIK
jgi:hypothetical protein